MKFLKKIFSNAISLLLLSTIAIITVLVIGRYNLAEMGRSVAAKTVIPEDNAVIVNQSPLAIPTIVPTATAKPPIDVNGLQIANVEQKALGPYYYSLLSPDGKYALANKTYQGHRLTKANNGDPSDVTGEWMRVYDLWLIGQESGKEKLITTTAAAWEWSPDSSAFAFITPAEKQGETGILNVFNLMEKTPGQITKVDLVLGYYQLYWLPTEEITYIADKQLWGIQRDGSNVRQILDWHSKQIEPGNKSTTYTGSVSEYAISPDGKRIAYTLVVPDSDGSAPSVQNFASELWVADIDGQNSSLITGDGYVLNWSPDGDWLVYSSSAFPDDEKAVARNLNSYSLKTGTKHLFYQPSNAFSFYTNIVWSPNSDVLAFRESQYSEPRIYPLIFTNPDGSIQKVFEIPEMITQSSVRMEWLKGKKGLLMTTFSEGIPDKVYELNLTVSSSE